MRKGVKRRGESQSEGGEQGSMEGEMCWITRLGPCELPEARPCMGEGLVRKIGKGESSKPKGTGTKERDKDMKSSEGFTLHVFSPEKLGQTGSSMKG